MTTHQLGHPYLRLDFKGVRFKEKEVTIGPVTSAEVVLFFDEVTVDDADVERALVKMKDDPTP